MGVSAAMIWKYGTAAESERDPVKKDTEKAEVFITFFIQVCTGKTALQESQTSETRGNVWRKEDLPSVEEDQVRVARPT